MATTNAKGMKGTLVKGKTMRPMYKVSEITNRTNKNLWVVFETNKSSKGLVFSGTYTRDQIRCAMAKITGAAFTDIRSQRVSTYRKSK